MPGARTGIVAHNGGAGGGVVAHRRWRRARREGAAVSAVSAKSAAVGVSRAGRSSILHLPTHKTLSPPSPPSPPFPFNCMLRFPHVSFAEKACREKRTELSRAAPMASSPDPSPSRSVSGSVNWSREVAARTEDMEAQIAELEAQSARLVSPTIGSRASTATARHEGSVALSFDLASPLVGSVGHGTKLLSTHEHLEQLMRNLTFAELCQAHPRTSRSARHLQVASVALAHAESSVRAEAPILPPKASSWRCDVHLPFRYPRSLVVRVMGAGGRVVSVADMVIGDGTDASVLRRDTKVEELRELVREQLLPGPHTHIVLEHWGVPLEDGPLLTPEEEAELRALEARQKMLGDGSGSSDLADDEREEAAEIAARIAGLKRRHTLAAVGIRDDACVCARLVDRRPPPLAPGAWPSRVRLTCSALAVRELRDLPERCTGAELRRRVVAQFERV